MYNANKPNPDELPSSAQLLKSTILAILAAIVILIAVVLPAEYGIDPTRAGRILGLTSMGEIKVQLAKEAEADRLRDAETPNGGAAVNDRSSWLGGMLGVFIGTANAQPATPAWTDEISFTLKPNQGAEYKLVMKQGATAAFLWRVDGGVVNYDLHGDGGNGKEVSYKKGRSVKNHEGTVEARNAGLHGWFWRNRGDGDVKVTLYVRGDYSEIKRTY